MSQFIDMIPLAHVSASPPFHPGQSDFRVRLATIDLSWTRDPFDRIIVANAAINHNILVTKDQNISTCAVSH